MAAKHGNDGFGLQPKPMQSPQTPPRLPLYISIGPPCCGKTTLLNELQGGKIIDIALDDQPNVYVKVPLTFFFQSQQDPLWNQSIHNKTIGSRIQDRSNREQSLVLQRLAGRLTKEQFEEELVGFYKQQVVEKQARRDASSIHRGNNQTNATKQTQGGILSTNDATSNNKVTIIGEAQGGLTKHEQEKMDRLEKERLESASVAKDLVLEVEDLLDSDPNIQLPAHIHLFVVESLFRPWRGQTGLERAQKALQRAASSNSSIAWGNTNARPREYKVALEVAAQSKRPVCFVAYHDPDLLPQETEVLPELPFRVLLKRNLSRMLQKGKYIPAQAIWDSSQRVQNIVQTGFFEAERDLNFSEVRQNETTEDEAENYPETEKVVSKFDFDRSLCRMVNFNMNSNRTVFPIPAKGRPLRDHGRNSITCGQAPSGRGRFKGSERDYPRGGTHNRNAGHRSHQGRNYQGNYSERRIVNRQGSRDVDRFRGVSGEQGRKQGYYQRRGSNYRHGDRRIRRSQRGQSGRADRDRDSTTGTSRSQSSAEPLSSEDKAIATTNRTKHVRKRHNSDQTSASEIRKDL